MHVYGWWLYQIAAGYRGQMVDISLATDCGVPAFAVLGISSLAEGNGFQGLLLTAAGFANSLMIISGRCVYLAQLAASE